METRNNKYSDHTRKIDKDNYHDYIFSSCANQLNEYIEKINTKKSSDQLHEIIKYLNIFSRFLSKSEHGLIESYNTGYINGVLESLGFLIYSIEDFYDIATPKDKLVLKNTKRELNRITGQRRQRYRYKAEMDINAIFREKPKLAPSPFGDIDKGIDKNLTNYYKLVSAIVEDINNLPGWITLRKYLNKHIPMNIETSDFIDSRPITFLSYAFKDNIYALFLYEYFNRRGGFLYVDSLFGKDYGDDGKKIKASLSPWIDSSSQILFLHSIHSDRVNKGLSSWCSWELGEAYKGNNKKFFKVVVAGITNRHSIIDDDFLELKEVRNGIIIPK